MKSLVLLAQLFAGISPSWAAPSVSNVRVSQRAGTNLVDVYYNLSGSGQSGASVSVELSDNSGTSYGLPISSLSGHVGGGIANGTNRYLVWNAGTDRPNSFSTTMRLRLTAVDTPPVPTGFALIPAGSFQMGDQSSPQVGNSNELPVHTVHVSAFYMGKYEVTKELWDEVRVWGLNNGYTDLAAGNGAYASKGANHPVHSITWWDIARWCNARSQKDGLTPVYDSAGMANWSANGYRLPTEAEWEKAARGGLSGKNFPRGNTISHGQANYFSDWGDHDGNSATPDSPRLTYAVSPTRGYHPAYVVGGYPYSSPVGSFAPNGYGLYDMAGNVWERCWGSFGSYTAGSQTDPRGEGLPTIGRGGGWGYDSFNNRVATRNGFLTGGSRNDFGFRLARSSVP